MCIRDSLQKLISTRRSRIDSLDITFSLCKLQPMCPDVSGVAHQRFATSQKHRLVVYSGMNNQGAWGCLQFYEFRKTHTCHVKDSILYRTQGDARYIEGSR